MEEAIRKVVEEVKKTEQEYKERKKQEAINKAIKEVELESKKKTEGKEEKGKGVKIAVIRVRGNIGVRKDIRDTLDMLKLYRKNYCVILPNTPSIMGMVRKCKDYVTWGEISDETLQELLKKRAEPNPKDRKKTKGFFRLAPPRKGYGRGGIKVPFKVGGALGYRGEKINDLIRRML